MLCICGFEPSRTGLWIFPQRCPRCHRVLPIARGQPIDRFTQLAEKRHANSFTDAELWAYLQERSRHVAPDQPTIKTATWTEITAEICATQHRWEIMTMVSQVRLMGDPGEQRFLCIVQDAQGRIYRFYEARRLRPFLRDFAQRYGTLAGHTWALVAPQWATIDEAKRLAKEAEKSYVARQG